MQKKMGRTSLNIYGISETWLHLLETLGTLATGPPVGLVLFGEPGVGKRTLWRYFLELTGDLTEPLEISGDDPQGFGPWIQRVQSLKPIYVHHWDSWPEDWLKHASRWLNRSEADGQFVWGGSLTLQTSEQAMSWQERFGFSNINMFLLQVPPLRERRDDIPVLAQMILRETAQRDNHSVRGWTPEAMEYLRTYPWWGNTQELREVVNKCLLSQKKGSLIESETVFKATQKAHESTSQPEWYDRCRLFIHRMFHYLRENPAGTNSIRPWHFILDEVHNQTAKAAFHLMGGVEEDTARLLGITRRTLKRQLQRHIEKPLL